MSKLLAAAAVSVAVIAAIVFAIFQRSEDRVAEIAIEAMRGAPGVATETTPGDADFDQRVIDAILANPEVVMQAVELLREREAQAQAEAATAALAGIRAELTAGTDAFVGGNPDGDVTVIEFFDYNCPYCKRAAASVDALIAADGNVRVIFREWPILSEGSVFAARAALAARQQGRYPEMHMGMMAAGRVDEATVLQIARDLGLDMDRLAEDMNASWIDAHIAATAEFSRTLGFNGTPSFVVGDALVPGMVDLETLQGLVAEARGR